MSKNNSVYGIYSTRAQVENGVQQLKEANYRNTDISVLFPHNEGSKDFAIKNSTKAPEGAAAGAAGGAVVGGALGWLAGIGALAIPGVGPFIAAGPIVAALAGAGAGGALAGVAGGLIGLGVSEYEAKRYAGRLEKGGILLSVHASNSDEVKMAKEILKRTGAEDISSGSEASPDYDKTNEPHPRSEVHVTKK